MIEGRIPLQLSDPLNIGVRDGNREFLMPIRDLCDRLEVDALIRLHKGDFSLLGSQMDSFVHFNLEYTLNVVGRYYAVVPIVKAGRRSAAGSEILPVVEPSLARRGLCTEVIQHLPIDEVTAAQFAASLPNIRTPKQLGDALLRRYQRMFPEKSADDLLGRGCTLTRLTFQDGCVTTLPSH